MSSPVTGLGALGQIALTVNDVQAAAEFYREAVGLRQIPIPAPTLAFFDCGGLRLMLSAPEKQFVPGGSALYFKVDDIDQSYATLRDRGVKFEDAPHLIARMPDHELWMTFFFDPSGNGLALMAEKRS
jgi:predicted enzyme related to lactoylglutathione lyase